MRTVNINQIKEDPWQSPGGKYAVSFKGISEALGREPASLDLSKRHPFDLEWSRVPSGKSNFPYHAHSAQWELYLVISGKGTVRHKDGRTEVVAGDAFIHVMGGRLDASSQNVDLHDVYNPSTNTWQAGAPLPTA